ncbi:hydrolase [Cryptosporidium ryanae]|uniref:hydrolase n=1 Tax=Cryptosporidium ryanae TaxID=515981 RepID=UPI003519EF52|nr:hydrolase [Cryptosporidium ryanae]
MWHNHRIFSGNFILRVLFLFVFLSNLTFIVLSESILCGNPDIRHECKYANLKIGKTHYLISCPDSQIQKESESGIERKTKRIVLIHGLLGSLNTFSSWSKILTSNGYTVLTYDLLGHGQSEWKIAGFISVEKLVLQLTQLLEEIGWANSKYKISLLGVSLGGLVSLKYTIGHADNVDKLVLMCPPGLMTREDSPKLYELSNSFEARLLSNVHRYQRAFRCGVNCLSTFGVFKFEKGISKKEKNAQINGLHREISTYVKIGGNNNLFERYADYYELSKLEDKVKIMFFWGTEDEIVPFRSSVDYLAQHFNSSRIVVFPFIGHIPKYNMNFPINIAVRFLDEVNVEEIGVSLGVVESSVYFYDYTVNIIKGFNFTYSGNKAVLQIDDTNYSSDFFDIKMCSCCFEGYILENLPQDKDLNLNKCNSS